MTWSGMNIWLVVLATIPALPSAEQAQSCPINITFSDGTLTHWQGYTGNNKDGNGPAAILQVYDSSQTGLYGTIGAVALPEYNLPAVMGIQVITSQGIDQFGSFPMIPTINGYVYHYSILLGSTSVTNHQVSGPNSGSPGNPGGPPAGGQGGPEGGYVRGVSYLIRVPPGPSTLPYTVTYAYAMVLENGTHQSVDQPMARAIVSTPGGIIECASPAYFLPTNGGLDSATARANGFTPSPVATPNESFNPGTSGQYLKDVWTKGWTEVTFDLSPYRGQTVSLTFEADNCVPGGHFAYAYFALRNSCAGLGMSGDTLACSNSVGVYSIPSLDSASYVWSTPFGWGIDSGGTGNTITVKIGAQPGWIVAQETNRCTSLTDSLFVQLYTGALPEVAVDPTDTTVCFGQAAPLHAIVTTGTEYSWASQASFSGESGGAISSLPFVVNVVAGPEQTTTYILSVRNEGCPITVSDTLTVTVVPPIHVNAGNDTLVVLDEPLHFQATSTDPYKDEYEWSPATGLNNPDVSNPVGLYGPDINKITYLVKATDTFGCAGSAAVTVTVARTLPDIFVPNAFTPAATSNNLFRPVCFGISSLEYFRVFNRWGQLLFSTSQMGQGWDGRIEGKLQESNAYLWALKGTDYTGKAISKNGTVMLIR
jgi:gliding motility-associated-like protein